MKILHYTLGFPPERSGGLVSYAIDVMEEQIAQNNEVIALFPGRINIFRKNMYIKGKKSLQIQKYELINSLPLPLFGGINSPLDFMKKTSIELFMSFLNEIKPDVIHVHTLMGIPKEFFQAAKEQNIEIVFTSHDYFGLAADPNFFFNGKSYDYTNSVNDWIIASTDAMTTKKLRLFQLSCYPFLRALKNIVKKKDGTSLERKKFFKMVKPSNQVVIEFKQLKEYYISIFSLIDKFHFNSSVACDVYKSNLKCISQYNILTITNRSIKKIEKIEKKKNTLKTKIAYIGPDKEYKGFYEFIELKNKLKKNSEYEFHTYGYFVSNKLDGMVQHGRYTVDSLDDVYKSIDILIVPSKWKETFGLIVLEAIAHNTLIYVSDNVGAKDILPKSNVYADLNDLVVKISESSGILCSNIKEEKEHVEELIAFYKE